RPVPRRPAPVQLVELPRIERGRLEPGRMRERRAILTRRIAEMRPDVVLVEHFPFAKWALRDEILAVLDAAQAPAYCSIREFPLAKDSPPFDEVAAELAHRFRGVLVHGDPRLAPFDLALPVETMHTGYVSEKPRTPRGEGAVVISVGGTGGERLTEVARAAWPEAEVFGSLGGPGPFVADFVDRLAGASLSISQAGYNTCTNILETRTPAVLAPHPLMPDQQVRARRFAELGLAQHVDAETVDVDGLHEAAARARAPRHDFDLDGARRTAALLSERHHA
ncbi:MAG: glycosyltransferase, partial [Planctomycetota bacterium]